MLDNFREWLSDNLRYILLGLAGILLIVIAFFAVKLISGFGKPEEKKPETEASTEASTQAQTAAEGEEILKKNDPEILALVERYYSACLEKDFDTLASICENFDDTAKANVQRMDAAVEAYSNYMTYSRPGLTEGSYVVYIYLELKLTGIETLAPTLREKYVLTDPEGHLVITETDSTDEIREYTEKLQREGDVQALVNDVDAAMDRAMAADEDLKSFVDSLEDTQSSGTTQQNGSGEEGSGENTSAQTGTMKTTDGVNVRGEASKDSTLYGTLLAGMEVEVLENLSNGWSKIRYTTNGTTIEGYMMTQYLEPVG